MTASDGQPLVFDAGGDPLAHDYGLAEMERLLRDGRYQLEELLPAFGLPIGRFRGFSNRELYIGLRELHVVDAPTAQWRRFLPFGS